MLPADGLEKVRVRPFAAELDWKLIVLELVSPAPLTWKFPAQPTTQLIRRAPFVESKVARRTWSALCGVGLVLPPASEALAFNAPCRAS
jgi:hypothetical protein